MAPSIVSRTIAASASTSSRGVSNSSSSWTVRSRRACRPEPRSRSATRIIAIFWMSAAVPWIGMLIAIRSPAPRSAGFEARSSGIWRLRPRSVSTQPWALAVSLIAIM